MENEQDSFRVGLRHYRKNLGISQDEIAVVAGISRSMIGGFETGHCNLSANSMDRVRKALFKLIGDRATAVGLYPASPLGGNHVGTPMHAEG